MRRVDQRHARGTSWCIKCGEPLPDGIKKTLPLVDARLTGRLVFDMPTADSRVAGFWIRAAARMIDQALGIVVGIISIIIATIVVAIRDPTGRPEVWLESLRGLSLLGMATSFLGNVAYPFDQRGRGRSERREIDLRLAGRVRRLERCIVP